MTRQSYRQDERNWLVAIVFTALALLPTLPGCVTPPLEVEELSSEVVVTWSPLELQLMACAFDALASKLASASGATRAARCTLRAKIFGEDPPKAVAERLAGFCSHVSEGVPLGHCSSIELVSMWSIGDIYHEFSFTYVDIDGAHYGYSVGIISEVDSGGSSIIDSVELAWPQTGIALGNPLFDQWYVKTQ